MSTANSPQIKRVPGSYADYQRLASTSSITEWVEGELRFMPSPSIVHQLILKLFFNLLEAVVNHQRLGLVLFAPFEVKLWSDGPARQPDIFFLTNEQRQSLSEQRFNGPPALVVEIVSPGSVREDQVEKFKEYEK
ncbi:MAG: Uma2 family endonuclease, partial [Chloroflexota bacterium]